VSMEFRNNQILCDGRFSKYPSYIPHLLQCDFYFFGPLKEVVCSCHITVFGKLWFRQQHKEVFASLVLVSKWLL
jgi:hypothetical protein